MHASLTGKERELCQRVLRGKKMARTARTEAIEFMGLIHANAVKRQEQGAKEEAARRIDAVCRRLDRLQKRIAGLRRDADVNYARRKLGEMAHLLRTGQEPDHLTVAKHVPFTVQ